MTRHKAEDYPYRRKVPDFFNKRLEDLKEREHYTIHDILDKLVDSEGVPYFESDQAYRTFRDGKRQPEFLIEKLVAIADLYGVTIDHLLKEDEPETPEIRPIMESTGLSDDSVKALLELKSRYPEIMEIINGIISCLNPDNIEFINVINFYNMIVNDYNAELNAQDKPLYTDDKIELFYRFTTTNELYQFLYTSAKKNCENALKRAVEQKELYNSISDEVEYK